MQELRRVRSGVLGEKVCSQYIQELMMVLHCAPDQSVEFSSGLLPQSC